MKISKELLFFLLSQKVEPIFQTGHFSKVNEVLFHHNNQNLISAGDDGKIIVWDINLGLQRSEVLAHYNGVNDIDLIDDSTVISLGKNNDISMWSFPELKLKATHKVPFNHTQALAVLENQNICVVGKKVHFYNLKQQHWQTANYESKGIFESVDFNAERKEVIVTGPQDNYAVAIKVDDPVAFKKYYVGNIHRAVYGNNLLLLATTKGVLQYANLITHKKHNFSLVDDLNYVTDMSTFNHTIAMGTAFGFTSIFSADDQKILSNVGLNGVSISALDYSSNGKWLGIANTKGIIYLYDTESYKLNKILKGASAGIVDLEVAGDKLVVGYSDGIIRYLDLPNNHLKSNSIKLDRIQEQHGINYAILSIDSIAEKEVKFTVLKTNRHHVKTSLITKAEKIKAVWKLDLNKIILTRKILDRSFSKTVFNNFRKGVPFHFNDYSEKQADHYFDGQKFVLNNHTFSFYKTDGKDTLFYPAHHKAPITSLKYLRTYQLILSYSNDGSIRFWNMNGEYLAVLYLSGQYSFFYQNNRNFYFASKEILNKIGFIYNRKLFAYEQYDVYYNRPNEVMENLPFFKKEDIVDYQRAYFKRLQKLGILVNTLAISNNLPEIEVAYLDEYSTEKEVVRFSLKMADITGKIVAYSYIINGIEKRLELETPQPDLTTELEIVLGAGINQVEFHCVNDKGVRSLSKKKIITCEKNFQKPDLFLVSIGVTNYSDKAFDLKYAKKDAEDIAALLNKTKTYANVHTKALFNESFTRKKKGEIETFLNQAQINDVIIFFYAGQGVLDDQFNYYLATHDMDFKDPQERGMPFDSLETLFEGLACRNKLIMIDACFSGEIDKTSLLADTNLRENKADIKFRKTQAAAIDGNGDMGIFELSKLTFTDLRVSKGTNILSSASGIEYAIEGDKWGNGLFTHVLKKGLVQKEADLNDDKQIRIMELQVYLRETVSTLSDGNQNPVLRKENIKNNFVIW